MPQNKSMKRGEVAYSGESSWRTHDSTSRLGPRFAFAVLAFLVVRSLVWQGISGEVSISRRKAKRDAVSSRAAAREERVW
jgi:hypothetical protein